MKSVLLVQELLLRHPHWHSEAASSSEFAAYLLPLCHITMRPAALTFPPPPHQTRALRCSGQPHLRLNGANHPVRPSHSLCIPAHTAQNIRACSCMVLVPLQCILFSGCCLNQQAWSSKSLEFTRPTQSKSRASASDPVVVCASLQAQIKTSEHSTPYCYCLCSVSCSAAAASTNRLGQASLSSSLDLPKAKAVPLHRTQS